MLKLALAGYFATVLLPTVPETETRIQDEQRIDQSSPSNVFRGFADAHNTGDFGKQLSLMSPVAKAMVVCSLMSDAALSSETRVGTRDQKFFECWTPRFNRYLKSNEHEFGSDSNGPLILAISKWGELDAYLIEYYEEAIEQPRAKYESRLAKLRVENTRAEGEFAIFSDKGLAAILEGQLAKPMPLGTQKIFFVKIDGSWFISTSIEQNGDLSREQ